MVMIKTGLRRLTQGFLTVAFFHFAWMGVAKWGLAVAGYTLTVDMFGMSGLMASLLVTPLITVINWVGIQHFIIPGHG